jgi:thiosulfate/3-mercaptopyruvate sulfurtransferase
VSGITPRVVTTQWLEEHLDDTTIRIVEVDEDTDAYRRGHVPNAVAVNWSTDLQDPVRRDFVSPDVFAALQDCLGITNWTPVVLYGGQNNWFAAYAYWFYKVHGHDDVRLVDGGRKTWEIEGRTLVTEPPRIPPTRGYQTATPNPDLRAFRHVRSPEESCIPWADAVFPDSGRFRSPETLRAVYGGRGFPSDRGGTHGGIAERSAHAWFVLHELLGLGRTR